MKPTETEDNANGEKVVSLKTDDDPVVTADHAESYHQNVSESSMKEGDTPDEKVLVLSSENGGEIVEVSHESPVSDAKWVCKSPSGCVSSTDSGWPSFVTKSSSQPYSLSEEEQAKVAALNLQHKALEACQKFLGGWACSDSEDDGNEDEDEDFDSEECEEYKFFERVFAEDVELRKYYENHHKDGDFYCLVCGGVGKKVWKRFKDSAALIQHSTAVLRTKRMRAHRAYAHVICKVVGWDIDQVPAIVLKDLDSSLAASRKLLAEPQKPAVSGIDDKCASRESPVSDAEWVCQSPSGCSGWPVTKSSSQPYSLSAEEQAKVAALNLQHRALEACQKFLGGYAGSDSDEDDNEDEDEDEDKDYDSEECEEYKFFERVFAEDVELRKYYENHHKDGDFYCLVCGGVGKKVWKRFKDSAALIQHSTAVLRTKRMRAHRAYAHVICKVVGWDIDQLPAIVLKDLDSSLAASKKLLAEPQKPAVSVIDDSCGVPDENPADH
ncbi:uncharacterized protein LOC130748887 isoform X2 [Lotus japonicus]|uniref:uncharacterized protein LOC130748887 isoform X2 n=1 Tax=Lotus japonicus TaxID=34305 RepID=UPI0025868B97|nr:uncharacterized protein LOC130748887 isoform X2 [Lotus japonicus]